MSTRLSSAPALIPLVLAAMLAGCGIRNPLKDEVAAIPATLPPPPAAPANLIPTGSIYGNAGLVGTATHRMMLAEDRRARGIGDTLTILLVERLQAEKQTQQNATRASERALDLPDAKPFSWIPEALFAGGTSSSFTGNGGTRQANRLSGEITVTVVDVLPNGALLVAGDRRITLTRGEEQVQLTGIVRPEDIGPDNRVASTRVADARLRYSGTGEVAAQSRQGWLSRFFDRITPF